MNEQEGTITRKRWFAQIPDALVADRSVSSNAVRVWARLDHYAGRRGDAMPSRSTLADDLGMSEATVKRALAELTAAGWITRRRLGSSNVWETVLNDQARVTGDPCPDPGRPRNGSRVTRSRSEMGHGRPGNGSQVTRPRKDRREEELERTSVGAADGPGELELGIDPAPAAGQSPVQILVGAYSDAYRDSGGIPSKAVLKACGSNVKRLIDQDDIPLPVLLQAVKRAGTARSKDLDRNLGEATQAYSRPAARKAMFAAWDENVARFTGQQTQIGA
jgi:hypothetical protein